MYGRDLTGSRRLNRLNAVDPVDSCSRIGWKEIAESVMHGVTTGSNTVTDESLNQQQTLVTQQASSEQQDASP